MCGIVAAIGIADAVGVVLDGLDSLEYRGYDSAGAAWLENGGLRVIRTPGRVADLRARMSAEDVGDARCAIGHTRWATHGQPSEKNAHPQVSADGRVAVVHNGIIDNYASLKEELEKGGAVFKSDTDTEVIANLVASRYRGDLLKTVEETLPLLDGTFALAFMAPEQPDLLVVARRSSPLSIGLGDGFNLAASDAVPLVPHTRRVVFLEDGQVAALSAGRCVVRQNGEPAAFSVSEIAWSAEAALKNGYPHYMLKEIFEQPMTLENMFRNRLRLPMSPDADPEFTLDGMYRLPDSYFQGVSRIVLLAQGTAYHACMVGRNMLERITRIPAYPEYAADFRYRDPILDPSVLAIAVTQSGETMDTLHAVRLAREAGCKVLAAVNVVGSSIAREADAVFYLNCGPEIGVASTKAFTAMIAGLYFLSLRIGQIRSSIDRRELRRRTLDLLGIGVRLNGILASDSHIRDVALKYRDARNFLFLGRGTGWPLAMEGALKLKEVSYIHAEGYDAAEMKHGPIALVDGNMPVLFIALSGRRYDKIIGNIQEVRARRGRIIAIASHGDRIIQGLADDVIYIRAESGIMNSICCAVPLQLLAYHIAVARGCDVDKPKNLAKSVTVE
ncbi:MAG: glutamine--fructose-6-phosphate transaminase (isomerizing) [Planctomycetota bacterium]|jgi:glucosamine--fructose-6-phosphate aminotransferase (isomerizing)|nr:glutamine--fructose-6-phosphate transaminase (isomerizing) [Planctomycetota bacterium]